jgi:hypothetical protein
MVFAQVYPLFVKAAGGMWEGKPHASELLRAGVRAIK